MVDINCKHKYMAVLGLRHTLCIFHSCSHTFTHTHGMYALSLSLSLSQYAQSFVSSHTHTSTHTLLYRVAKTLRQQRQLANLFYTHTNTHTSLSCSLSLFCTPSQSIPARGGGAGGRQCETLVLLASCMCLVTHGGHTHTQMFRTPLTSAPKNYVGVRTFVASHSHTYGHRQGRECGRVWR